MKTIYATITQTIHRVVLVDAENLVKAREQLEAYGLDAAFQDYREIGDKSEVTIKLKSVGYGR